jgi:NADP-dependent 3-hydroxy acid dehydrogenase YdfG
VDNWRQILDLNVLGLSICTKEAIESMNEKQVHGHIININRSVTVQSYIDIYSPRPIFK